MLRRAAATIGRPPSHLALRYLSTPIPSSSSSSPVPAQHHSATLVEDPSVAFKDKSDLEIARAWFVFRLCAIKPVVDNAPQLLKLSRCMRSRVSEVRRCQRHFASALSLTLRVQTLAGRCADLRRHCETHVLRTLLRRYVVPVEIIQATRVINFITGTSGPSIQNTVDRLQRQNVCSTLNPSALADVPSGWCDTGLCR
jgi:hypothetical protein